MKDLKIAIHLDTATAIRLGQAKAGAGEWPLAGVLPLLDDELREWVAEHGRNDPMELPYAPGYRSAVELTEPPSDESVASAIGCRRGEYDEHLASEKAEAEARIVKALEAPDGDWLAGGKPVYYTKVNSDAVSSDDTGHPVGRPAVRQVPSGVYLSDTQLDDPRIIARRVDVEARALPAAIESWEKRYAEWQAACEARKQREAEEVAKKEATREAIRQWAATCEELPARVRRAAADGIDVYPTLKRHLADAVRAVVLKAVEPLGSSIENTYGDEVSSRVPSDEAYAIFDAIEAAKDDIAQAAIVPGVEVKVGPFMRVDVAKERKEVWRSAVAVSTSHPWFGDLVGAHILTEPLALGGDDE